MKSLIPALLGILAFPLFSPAVDDAYFTKQVGILIEYYEVDHTTCLKLLREYQQQDNANELLKSMQGTATLRDDIKGKRPHSRARKMNRQKVRFKNRASVVECG